MDIGRIGVLMGGTSSEKEISLKSGKAVYEALISLGCEAVLIELNSESIREVRNRIINAKISIAFIALHGRFGEDGTIQGVLESMDIPYTGSGVTASRLAMDKIASREVFQKQGILVPKYRVVRRDLRDPSAFWPLDAPSAIGKNTPRGQLNKLDNFPIVVKPSSCGSSIGLSIVDRKEGLLGALESAFHYDNIVIIEEYIKGREVTVGILEDKPLPVIQIISKRRFFDYQAKYQKGITEYIVPAELPEKQYKEVQGAGLRAHLALGCRSFSRVDMILTEKGRPIVLEVNTIPGLTSVSLLPKAAMAKGIDFPQLVLRMVNSTKRV